MEKSLFIFFAFLVLNFEFHACCVASNPSTTPVTEFVETTGSTIVTEKSITTTTSSDDSAEITESTTTTTEVPITVTTTTTEVPSTVTTTTTTTTTTTETPTTTTTVIDGCSPDLVTYGTGDGDDPEVNIDVYYKDYSTDGTTSTMTVGCSAIDGYNTYMIFNDGEGGPSENQDAPQTIEVTLTCDVEENVWNYVVTINGVTYTREIDQVDCQQASNE